MGLSLARGMKQTRADDFHHNWINFGLPDLTLPALDESNPDL